MTVSPMFCERFQQVLYEKLQSVNESQLVQSQGDNQLQQPATVVTTNSYPSDNNDNSSSILLSSASFSPQQPTPSSQSSNPSLHTSTSPSNTTNTQDNWIR